MTEAMTILLVEDDERLAQLIARYLEGYGVRVDLASDGPAGETAAVSGDHDCVVLDVQLPGRDGFAVCRGIRTRSDVPVIMISARGGEDARVCGLEAGADDFLAKPLSPRELLARLRACVRRSRGETGPALQPMGVGRLLLDARTTSATFDGAQLALTAREFSLLRTLAEHAGTVVAREQLLVLTTGSSNSSERALDVLICRLREKLGDDAREPRFLKTIRGVGYMLLDGVSSRPRASD